MDEHTEEREAEYEYHLGSYLALTLLGLDSESIERRENERKRGDTNGDH